MRHSDKVIVSLLLTLWGITPLTAVERSGYLYQGEKESFDWYLRNGTVYVATVVSPDIKDIDLYLYDSQRNLVAKATSTTDNLEMLTYLPERTGYYKLVVKAYRGTGNYVLKTFYDDNPVAGTICNNSLKVYSVTYTSGTPVIAIAGGDGDIDLYVIDPYGNVIVSEESTSNTELAFFSAPVSGSYKFVVKQASSGCGDFFLVTAVPQ